MAKNYRNLKMEAPNPIWMVTRISERFNQRYYVLIISSSNTHLRETTILQFSELNHYQCPSHQCMHACIPSFSSLQSISGSVFYHYSNHLQCVFLIQCILLANPNIWPAAHDQHSWKNIKKTPHLPRNRIPSNTSLGIFLVKKRALCLA